MEVEWFDSYPAAGRRLTCQCSHKNREKRILEAPGSAVRSKERVANNVGRNNDGRSEVNEDNAGVHEANCKYGYGMKCWAARHSDAERYNLIVLLCWPCPGCHACPVYRTSARFPQNQ